MLPHIGRSKYSLLIILAASSLAGGDMAWVLSRGAARRGIQGGMLPWSQGGGSCPAREREAGSEANVGRGKREAGSPSKLTAWGGPSVLPRKFWRAQTLPDSGQVVVVYDGDTVKVRFADGNERKIRLIGIDSPEVDDEREEVRFMALMAKRFAFLNLYRKNVDLAYDWQIEDQYGRLLAYLTTDNGSLFNELILKEGFAFVYRKFPFRQDLMERFESAAEDARRTGKGLWRKESPPEIPASAARAHLGQLVSVRMTCAGLEERRSFAVLRSEEVGFEALIPRESKATFPDLKGLIGQTIVVTGLVEEFEGALQVLLYLPRQLVFLRQLSGLLPVYFMLDAE